MQEWPAVTQRFHPGGSPPGAFKEAKKKGVSCYGSKRDSLFGRVNENRSGGAQWVPGGRGSRGSFVGTFKGRAKA